MPKYGDVMLSLCAIIIECYDKIAYSIEKVVSLIKKGCFSSPFCSYIDGISHTV